MYSTVTISILSLFLLPASLATSNDVALPRVFEIGKHERAYELLSAHYQTSLLEVCNNDMKNAFKKLSAMYREMEVHASNIGYEVGGVRSWLHVFWGSDGTIEHLGFHLRPNSRNVDVEEFEAFLLSFVQEYRFPLFAEQKYALYTSVSFPVSFRSIKDK